MRYQSIQAGGSRVARALAELSSDLRATLRNLLTHKQGDYGFAPTDPFDLKRRPFRGAAFVVPGRVKGCETWN